MPPFIIPRKKLPQRKRLTEEIAGPTVTGVRQVLSGHPAQGLTPERLTVLLRSAEEGDPVAFLELAEEMEEKDLHYRSVLSTRKLQVSGLPVTVAAASDSAEDVKAADLVRDFINTGVLQGAMQDIADAIGKGYSCCEIMWDTEGKNWTPSGILWRDPRWFIFDRDDGITLHLLGENGQREPLEAFKFITHIHKSKSGLPIRGGLARPAAWFYLFKNFDIKSWVEFVQIFGFPLRLGKYDSSATAEDRQTLLRAVRNITKDAAAIIPQGMDITFESTDVRGNVTVFEGLANYFDKQISKLVLGQTGTTDTGQHVGTADAHEKVREDICRDDAKQIAATLNRDLVIPLVDLNLGPRKHYPHIVIEAEEAEDVTAWLDNVLKAADHYEGEEGFAEVSIVRDKLGVPEPAPGAAAIGRGFAAKIQDDGTPPPGKEAHSTQGPPPGDGHGPDEDAIDTAVREEMEGWEMLVSPLAAPIIALAESCNDYDEFLARLPGIIREQDPGPLGNEFALAMMEQYARGRGNG